MGKNFSRRFAARTAAYTLMLATLLCTTANHAPVKSQGTVLDNPILFVLVPPPISSGSTFGHQLETFGNHGTSMRVAPRGGDLCLMDGDGNVRLLTKEAGFGVESGEIQDENGIAVRQPCVHWDGSKALFSMIIGGPIKAYDQSYRENKWQIYELTNLDEVIAGQKPEIVRVENQPNYNNISPIYGSDDQIIYTSDAPLFDLHHTYPQLDEYESAETNTGIFKLNPTTGDVIHLTHSPSGDFDIHLASDGRIISTRWEHLKRDQQADAHRAGLVQWAPVNFESENEAAEIINAPSEIDGKPHADPDGTPYEVFPEALAAEDPTRDPNEPLHDFNEFLPWEITENGERHQTMNHVGRHEFGGVFQHGSKMDDPNLIYTLGNFSKNAFRETIGSDAGIFQIKEDPRPGHEGTFYGAWSREFARMASGRIFQFSLPIGANPQDMEIIDWTHPDIDNTSNDKGHFRGPVMTVGGTMLVSHARESGLYSRDHVYHFQIAKMVPVTGSTNATEHTAGTRLTGEGYEKEIVYWGDFTTPVSETVRLNEVDIVEVVPRPRPSARPKYEIASVEKEVLEEEGVDEQALRDWMIEHNLALIAIRNATERDQGEQQQPFNLRVPGGVETIPADGKVYEISHFQMFEAEMIRGYKFRNLRGRRVLATALRNTEFNPNVEEANLLDPDGPEGSVKIGMDGSIAAFIPATRAMTWQTVSPTGEPIVRERQWLTFAPGEIRTCEGCHGINGKTHAGNGTPTNKPQALRDLLKAWKSDVGGVVSGIDPDGASSSHGIVLYQNYPNPFGETTTIGYTLPESMSISLSIYNTTGQEVRRLVSRRQIAGFHNISWDGKNQDGVPVGPGIFICELKAGKHSITNKVLLN